MRLGSGRSGQTSYRSWMPRKIGPFLGSGIRPKLVLIWQWQFLGICYGMGWLSCEFITFLALPTLVGWGWMWCSRAETTPQGTSSAPYADVISLQSTPMPLASRRWCSPASRLFQRAAEL